ncbi:MAG TPA: type II toxin-antitoxin system HipA family toxin [Erwinia persicina]|uniref:type II toxin-antitoxin system HipA family toxin n=1 Tax=Erwinia persicina TaxID=55211 RepID=UPI0007896C6D|nr:type II toxin-antitoxin system HipA family toxin [Erwinia persicina]AXU98192.1 type II toxin-antitoxin system HipA family toxin [Erwinia persicina]MBD8169725.1 type II toxin-antitoxin system HipA family toxin [Erwinia persicina]MCQ4095929.1 type II toxin-antitoxin system HipA family toxin [Erwinia persicina]MCQ4102468.1 type II toxin-antitoxin system HipA family toxin [Erwinia persicina]MCQ4105918.1 type II toxin-antitoxin system HipA family toxin [Erwinia persicina]
MVSKVDVWYEGWGERWLWGSLASSTALTGRPQILFEYSEEAVRHGLELASLTLPLSGPRLRRAFPAHQMGLPGPVYDALPDGWGMLLMDRLFRQRGLNAARIGPLERLTWIGDNAMGAMSFVPSQQEEASPAEDIALAQLSAEVQEVLDGEGGEFLQRLLLMGGSPQGARPKALLYRDATSGAFTTAASTDREAWLIKFPARQEHPEVCAIEAVYAQCLRACQISTPETAWFALPNGQAAFASRRFDRQNGMRVPMQSLAAFTGANYQTPGALDYTNFLRATWLCTHDVRQKALAFERVVFNVVFNNRDDHPKNFAYLMSAPGQWQLAPAYDVTWCEGPGGYHQMDVMGEALDIGREHLLALGQQEAELTASQAGEVIERHCEVASGFTRLAGEMFPGQITPETLRTIQQRIDDTLKRMLK